MLIYFFNPTNRSNIRKRINEKKKGGWSKNQEDRPGVFFAIAYKNLGCVASVSIWPSFGAKKDCEPKFPNSRFPFPFSRRLGETDVFAG